MSIHTLLSTSQTYTNLFVPHINFMRQGLLLSIFTDLVVEAQRKLICPRFHTFKVVDWHLNPDNLMPEFVLFILCYTTIIYMLISATKRKLGIKYCDIGSRSLWIYQRCSRSKDAHVPQLTFYILDSTFANSAKLHSYSTICIEKNLHVNGPLQFTPVLFKG